jgi:hypothetical protein
MTSAFVRMALWLLTLMVALVSAETRPRSSDLLTVLASLENELPECAVGCHPSIAHRIERPLGTDSYCSMLALPPTQVCDNAVPWTSL